ncbi:MAG TPA: hypothetical protein VIG73_08195 [Cerasibacillus sp.]|uniref:hypothetical protein n=1 Tax=Cerasibacillus sp. TaxID=2498711 RepID=UPI002F3E2A7D
MNEQVIILDNANFMFGKVELAHITKFHNEGMHYKEIAKKFKREPLEIVLALLHQASEGKVSLRTFGYIQV